MRVKLDTERLLGLIKVSKEVLTIVVGDSPEARAACARRTVDQGPWLLLAKDRQVARVGGNCY